VSVAWWLDVRRGARAGQCRTGSGSKMSAEITHEKLFFWRQKSKNSFEHITFYKISKESNPGKNTSKGIESW